ncbi:solute carrier family 2, facilitated glucose transporter member 11-like isoform X2 [Pristis pectinata]|uniref:solute carrier family 2, facilitated glucose transporter member 11-like isoform X2 n=1 Tax=Pristis pectinata TaxID=685728 RepID=UPI00223E8BED|nr:solute carrier family 2, facilitated glucose transporter member 11-like isoform X2 [Pristis pectinata]
MGRLNQFHLKVLLLLIVVTGMGGTFQHGLNMSLINAPSISCLLLGAFKPKEKTEGQKRKINLKKIPLKTFRRPIPVQLDVAGPGGFMVNGDLPGCCWCLDYSEYIKYFINETWLERHGTAMEEQVIKAIWSVIVSVYPIGAMCGALIAGQLSVRYGRRNCLVLNNIVAIVGAIIVGFSRMAKSFEMILVARFLYGVNSGNGMNIHCMYLMECSPKKLRGLVTITTAIFNSLGKCLGQIVGLREILGSESVWPLLMAFNAIPAFIQLVILPWFPESPRYLLIDKGNRALSMNALQRLWGKRDFSQELEEMQAERTVTRGERSRSVWELCKDPSVRSQLIINMMMSLFIQLSGINAIYSYAFEIFYAAGIPEETIPYVSIGTGLIETLTLLICGFFVERTGRKTLLCGGLGFMSLWTGLFTVTFSLQHLVSWMPYCSLVIIFAYVLSYGLGPGGVAMILPSEIFLQSDRPAGYVINGFLNWFGLFLIGMFFPFMVDGLGYLCFLIFSGVCLVFTLLGYFILVETRGKTPLEISEEFKNRKFFQNAMLHVTPNGALPQSTVEIIMSTAF